jgi:hypothetical protein
VDLGFERQALRVYQQVSLAPFDLLGPVVAALFCSHPGALDRLGSVQHARARLGISVCMRTRRRLRKAALTLFSQEVPSSLQVLK